MVHRHPVKRWKEQHREEHLIQVTIKLLDIQSKMIDNILNRRENIKTDITTDISNFYDNYIPGDFILIRKMLDEIIVNNQSEIKTDLMEHDYTASLGETYYQEFEEKQNGVYFG
jgi:hypothetical protein